MHMETTQHQFTFVRLNLRHNKQFTDRGQDTRGNHRIIGQIVVENYLDIGARPHTAMVPAASPNARGFQKVELRERCRYHNEIGKYDDR
jgi:hypothetical protein